MPWRGKTSQNTNVDKRFQLREIDGPFLFEHATVTSVPNWAPLWLNLQMASYSWPFVALITLRRTLSYQVGNPIHDVGIQLSPSHIVFSGVAARELSWF